ncbi:MAG: hypothetical protein PSY12_06470 [bacterium]|nr:hypothetical protein [bacterium]
MPRSNLAIRPSVSQCIEELGCTAARGPMAVGQDRLDVPGGESPALDLQRQLEAAFTVHFGNRIPVAPPRSVAPFVGAVVVAAGCWGVIFGAAHYFLT